MNTTLFLRRQSASISSAEPMRILLLESNCTLAEMLKSVFEWAGFHVSVAHIGSDASRLLNEHQFQLAMVNIDLPDGFKAILEAHVEGQLCQTKIILCSDIDSPICNSLAKYFGGIFICRPFDMNELVDAIDSAMATSKLRNDSTLKN